MFPLYDNNPTERTPLVTYALVIINVCVFLWMGKLDSLQHQIFVYKHGFVPARIIQLNQPHPISIPVEIRVQRSIWGPRLQQRVLELPPEPQQIYASLITCMFIHGSWVHLIGNMWFLWLFGNNVEDRLGKFLFLLLYITGGLIGSLAHWLADPESLIPVIGASGAIAAILGAYAVTWPFARINTLIFLVFFVTIVEIPALVVLGMWFLYQLMAGQAALHGEAIGGVAWWAHIGGFVAGMILMPVFEFLKPEQPPPSSGMVLD